MQRLQVHTITPGFLFLSPEVELGVSHMLGRQEQNFLGLIFSALVLFLREHASKSQREEVRGVWESLPSHECCVGLQPLGILGKGSGASYTHRGYSIVELQSHWRRGLGQPL